MRPATQQSFVEKIKTDSILNPLLWLCGISTPVLLAGACWLPEGALRSSLIVAVFLVIVAPIVAYFIWMFKDPNRLHSENHQMDRMRFEHELLADDRQPGYLDLAAEPTGNTIPSSAGQL